MCPFQIEFVNGVLTAAVGIPQIRPDEWRKKRDREREKKMKSTGKGIISISIFEGVQMALRARSGFRGSFRAVSEQLLSPELVLSLRVQFPSGFLLIESSFRAH